jgi:hypothetical protein
MEASPEKAPASRASAEVVVSLCKRPAYAMVLFESIIPPDAADPARL